MLLTEVFNYSVNKQERDNYGETYSQAGAEIQVSEIESEQTHEAMSTQVVNPLGGQLNSDGDEPFVMLTDGQYSTSQKLKHRHAEEFKLAHDTEWSRKLKKNLENFFSSQRQETFELLKFFQSNRISGIYHVAPQLYGRLMAGR